MTVTRGDHAGGLRELKKTRTRAAIQDHALRLYLTQGYANTTVEQIAEAADVSQSTFFRYFPTKAETVLYDRLDPVMMEALVQQPAELPPLAAVRAAIHEVLDQIGAEALELEKSRWKLVVEVPELRAAVFERTGESAMMLAEAIGERVGRPATDVAVLTWVGAVTGAVIAAFTTGMQDPEPDLLASLDAAISYLEAGLPL
jgi:AcrR family transcriptional regulator